MRRSLPGSPSFETHADLLSLLGKPKYLNFQDYQSLLFPCHSFDHAKAFQQATRYLVYHGTGHIMERKPEGIKDDHLRLESNIIQQLNAARGRLKTVLHRKLYERITILLRRTHCDCKAETLYAYELALSNTGAWPLETAFLSNSIDQIMNYLDNFRVEPDQMSKMCGDCSFDFRTAVYEATQSGREYFDGLCLGKTHSTFHTMYLRQFLTNCFRLHGCVESQA